jgi:hypothetical protein
MRGLRVATPPEGHPAVVRRSRQPVGEPPLWGVIGTLDIYAREPRDWDPSDVAALQAYGGLVASLLSAAVTAQVKGRLADVAREVTAGQPLPADRQELAKARARQAKDRELGG